MIPDSGVSGVIPDSGVSGVSGVIPDSILDEEKPETSIAIKDETGEVVGFKKLKPLNLREALFVREYIKDFDNKAVAKRMSVSVSKVQGLLARKHVKAEVHKMAEKQFRVLEMDANWVLMNIREVVERCMDEEKFDAPNALRGLELVGKRHSMFTDKVEVDNRTVIRIESNVGNVLNGIIDVTPGLPKISENTKGD